MMYKAMTTNHDVKTRQDNGSENPGRERKKLASTGK